MRRACKILGTFNFSPIIGVTDFNQEQQTYFSGNFSLKEDGTFVGELEDCYGPSSIEGKFETKFLTFTKKYYPSAKSKDQIYLYLLARRTSDAGYAGSWKLVNDQDGPYEGMAACAVFFTV